MFFCFPAPSLGKGGNGVGGSEHLPWLPRVPSTGAKTTLPQKLKFCTLKNKTGRPLLDLGMGDQRLRVDIGAPWVWARNCQRAARNVLGTTRGPALTSVDVIFRRLSGGCWGRSEITENHWMGRAQIRRLTGGQSAGMIRMAGQ